MKFQKRKFMHVIPNIGVILGMAFPILAQNREFKGNPAVWEGVTALNAAYFLG